MKKNVVKNFLLLAALSSMLVACNKTSLTNQTSSLSGKSADEMKSLLVKEVPGLTKIDEVNSTPVSGIYEIVVGRKVFYSTAEGKYLFFGNLVDAEKKQSLTDNKVQELSKIDPKLLPLDLAIKEVNGTGKRVLYVFSDPECPYCHMFEKQTVPFLKDTTIYVFLFPLPMHQMARPDAEKIWCSKDRVKVWQDWMREKIAPPVANTNCDKSGLDKIYKIGNDLVQVNGTPTLILSNGEIVSGALPTDQLLQLMDKALEPKTSTN